MYLRFDCLQELLCLVEVREYHYVHHKVLVTELKVNILVFAEHVLGVKPHVYLLALLRLESELTARRPASGAEMQTYRKLEGCADVERGVIFDDKLLLLEG